MQQELAKAVIDRWILDLCPPIRRDVLQYFCELSECYTIEQCVAKCKELTGYEPEVYNDFE